MLVVVYYTYIIYINIYHTICCRYSVNAIYKWWFCCFVPYIWHLLTCLSVLGEGSLFCVSTRGFFHLFIFFPFKIFLSFFLKFWMQDSNFWSSQFVYLFFKTFFNISDIIFPCWLTFLYLDQLQHDQFKKTWDFLTGLWNDWLVKCPGTGH